MERRFNNVSFPVCLCLNWTEQNELFFNLLLYIQHFTFRKTVTHFLLLLMKMLCCFAVVTWCCVRFCMLTFFWHKYLLNQHLPKKKNTGVQHSVYLEIFVILYSIGILGCSLFVVYSAYCFKRNKERSL